MSREKSRFRSARMFYSMLIVVLFVGIQPPLSQGQNQQSNLELNYDIDKYKYITRGEDLILTCKNKINREYVSWKYPTPANARIQIQNGINSQLTVKNASDDITGIYRCSVDYAKPDGTSVTIENSIDVVSSPLIKPNDTNIEVNVGKILTLQCFIVGGVPIPKFQKWHIQHENTSLPRNVLPFDDYDGQQQQYQTVDSNTERWQLHSNDEKQEKGKFVINQAELDDAGNYTCFAANDIASSTKLFIVKVSEPPTTTTVTTKIVTKSTSVKPDDKYLPAGTTEIPGETVTQGKATEKPDDNDSQGGDEGLGGGIIALIVILAIGVILIAGLVIIFLVRSKHQKRELVRSE